MVTAENFLFGHMDVDTEVRILQSDLLALQVIKQLNLDHHPGLGGRGKQR